MRTRVSHRRYKWHWRTRIGSAIGVGLASGWIATVSWSQPVEHLSAPSPQPIHEAASPIRGRQAADPAWAKIHRRGALRVGIDPAFGYDYLFADANARSYDGFEWQILQAVAARIGVALQPIPIPWSQQLAALNQDRVDLIWGAREATGLDAQHFLPTRPYYNNPQAMLVRSDRRSDIREFSDLFGLRVGIVVKSTGAALMDVYNQNRGRALRLFASRDLDRLVEQLRQQELDAVIIDRPIATAIARQSQTVDGVQAFASVEERESDGDLDSVFDGSEFAVVGQPVMPLPLVGVVPADRQSVKDALDEAIAALEREGKLNEILEQWQL